MQKPFRGGIKNFSNIKSLAYPTFVKRPIVFQCLFSRLSHRFLHRVMSALAPTAETLLGHPTLDLSEIMFEECRLATTIQIALHVLKLRTSALVASFSSFASLPAASAHRSGGKHRKPKASKPRRPVAPGNTSSAITVLRCALLRRPE
jgi:hypothetical protein